MAVVACPTLTDLLSQNECLENFAGLGTNVYIGLKSDLTSVLKMTDGIYSTPVFQAGKGLFKIQCKENTVGIKGSSLGRRKGFSLELTFTLEAVNQQIAKLTRAINNLDIFVICEDNGVSQIMYSPQYKVVADSGGIASDTGQKAEDERQTVITLKLSPVTFQNEYVTNPEGEDGWDGMLASKAAA